MPESEMAIKVQAAVMRERGRPFSIETVDLAPPTNGEVLVRMVACGICHTDVACRDAVIPLPTPIVLGHEGAGVVEQVGPGVSDLSIGDHVLLSFGSCGRCASCLCGHTAYCKDFGPLNFSGGRLDGSTTLSRSGEEIHSHFFGQSAFASHVVVARRNVIPVPKDAPLELLAPLGCGFQTGAGAVLNAQRPGVGDSLVVFGVGAVGMSALMAAKASGCSTIAAVDRVPDRLRLARELGATHTISAESTEDTLAAVRSICPSGFNYSIDTTGVGDVVGIAVQSLASMGNCALLGMYPPGVKLPFDARLLVLNGLSITGVVEGNSQPEVFIPKLISLYQRGQLPIDRVVSHYPFSQINEAMEASARSQVIKPVLTFSESELSH
jgi:aryl-alcohol dehydrogenase